LKSNITVLTVALAALSLASTAHAATNLLVNGSFETGDETGWADPNAGPATSFVTSGPSPVVGDFGNTSATTSVVDGAEQGVYYLANGTNGFNDVITQTFSDVAGQSYSVSGWVASDSGLGQQANWALEVDGVAFASQANAAQQGWVYYSGTFVGTGSDTFDIVSRNDPNYFDNLQVLAVPEPAGWALMLVGLGALGATLRSRRQAGAAAV